MKQLSALGARRQFFRNPRRLRLLHPGEELLLDGGAHDLMHPGGPPPPHGFAYFPGNNTLSPNDSLPVFILFLL